MTQSKPTPGPWALHPIAGKSGRNKLALHAAGRRVCDISVFSDEDSANARLIAEAGTVAHETGLTPRQLAEQRAELLDFARDVAGLDDGALTRADLNYFRSLILEWRGSARAALAKAEGGAS